MQTSESFRLSAFLSFSGGLQDAYTYNVRGQVFANAQTGNVVLMSQSFLMRDWNSGMQYMVPLLAFAAGVFVAERVEHRFKKEKAIHWRQIILALEIVMLGIVGLLPAGLNLPANIIVSFACAMQVQTFRKVHGYGYASTMCIGNLRSGMESMSRYLRNRDRASLDKALHFFGIILIFALGAGFGGVVSGALGIRTIWLSVLLLLIVFAMMKKENR
jgi:uncharacterized membrane protein YoaK (UPF0700 family)